MPFLRGTLLWLKLGQRECEKPAKIANNFGLLQRLPLMLFGFVLRSERGKDRKAWLGPKPGFFQHYISCGLQSWAPRGAVGLHKRVCLELTTLKVKLPTGAHLGGSKASRQDTFPDL
eukprot:1138770-Pelagomonas_calceolata.AAC.8